VWFALSLAAGTAVAIDCPDPIPHPELVAAMDEIEASYIALEDQAFRDGVNQLAGLLLPCAGEALPPSLAARHHRVMMLHLHGIGDETNAQLSMAAAKSADPEYGWSDELLAPNHPLRQGWEALEVDAATRKVPEPKVGSVAFDGINGRERPKDYPTIAQVFDESGQALSTSYLAPRENLPAYRAVPRTRNVLIGCSAGSALLAGGAYGMAWAANSRLYSEAANQKTSADALLRAQDGTQLWTLTSHLFVAGAASCGVGAVVVGER